jgi:hypothetical protein
MQDELIKLMEKIYHELTKTIELGVGLARVEKLIPEIENTLRKVKEENE